MQDLLDPYDNKHCTLDLAALGPPATKQKQALAACGFLRSRMPWRGRDRATKRRFTEHRIISSTSHLARDVDLMRALREGRGQRVLTTAAPCHGPLRWHFVMLDFLEYMRLSKAKI